MQSLQELNLGSPWSSCSSRCKFCWFLKSVLWSLIFPLQAQPRKLYVGIRSLASQGQPSWLWYTTTSAWPLEKEMAAHSSILAWRILWMEETGGLLSIGPHRVGHYWGDWACMHAWPHRGESSDQTTSARPILQCVLFAISLVVEDLLC